MLKKGIQATEPVTGDVEKWPLLHNINFSHVRVTNVTDLVAATNIPPERPVDGLTLANISGTCANAITLANMTNVNLSGVKVTGFHGQLVRSPYPLRQAPSPSATAATSPSAQAQPAATPQPSP